MRWLTPVPLPPLPPAVKANTQKKGGEDKKVGGGGAAGMAARTGGAVGLVCELCKTKCNAKAPRSVLMEHVDSKHSKVADAFKVRVA